MSPQLWKRVVDALEALEPLDAPRRDAELDRLRGADPEAASEVARLLRQQETTGTFDLDSVLDSVLRELGWTAAAGAARQEKMPEQIGPYRVVAEVGRGGMGVVYRARDRLFHRSLAVKLCQDDTGPNAAENKRRFLEEAQLMGQLQHPGIPPVHDRGAEPDGRPYFVMKLIKGQTLADLLKQRLSPDDDHPRLLAIFEQICQTLAYTHSQRVVHRDLKPANVMIGAFGEVQVMDWGLAKRLPRGPELSEQPPAQTSIFLSPRDQTEYGAVMGTPAYMAPEQARGDIAQLDVRSDVFGLGAILCEILTGQPPYQGSGSRDIWEQAKLCATEQALSRLEQCSADRELVHLTKRCLARDQQDRPADAGVVRQALTAHVAAVQERLRQAQLARAQAEVRSVEERKRRRLYLTLTGTALAALIGISVLAAVLAHRNEELLISQEQAKNKTDEAEMAKTLADAKRQEAERERDRAEAMSYRAVLARIDMACAENDIPAMRSVLLDSLPVPGRPDLRGLEWRLGLSLIDREIGGGRVHFPVLIHAVSSDGSTIAFAGKEIIQIVDTAGKKKPITIDRRKNPLLEEKSPPPDAILPPGVLPPGLAIRSQLVLSGDGSLLGVAMGGRPVTIWKDGHLHCKVDVRPVGPITFTPDGRRIAVASAKGHEGVLSASEVTFWNTDSGEPSGPSLAVAGDVFDLTFCEKKPIVAVNTSTNNPFSIGIVQVFDVATAKEVCRLERGPLNNIFFSPDGAYLFGTGFNDSRGKPAWFAWRLEDKKAQLSSICPAHDYDAPLTISVDEQLFATSLRRTTRLFRVRDESDVLMGGPLLDTFAGHRDKVVTLKATRKGLLSVDSAGVFKLWRTDSASKAAQLAADDPGEIVISLDGHTLVTELLFRNESTPIFVRRSAGDRLTLAARPIKTVAPLLGFDPDVLAVSADGDTVARSMSSMRQGENPFFLKDTEKAIPPRLIVWHGLLDRLPGRAGGRPIEGVTLEESWTRAVTLALSPDGTRLAVTRADDAVQLWELTLPLKREPKMLLPPRADQDAAAQARASSTLAFSPDGNMLCHGWQGDLFLWDLPSGQLRLQKNISSTGISSLAISGNRLIAAGTRDGRVLLWDGTPAGPVTSLAGHTGPVTQLAFAPDGQTIASAAGGLDGSIKLWDAVRGTELVTLQRKAADVNETGREPEVAALAFQKGGPSLIALYSDGSVRIWRALSEQLVYETVLRDAALEPDSPRMKLARVQACWGYAQDRRQARDLEKARHLLEEGVGLLRELPESAQFVPGLAKEQASAERTAWLVAFEQALSQVR